MAANGRQWPPMPAAASPRCPLAGCELLVNNIQVTYQSSEITNERVAAAGKCGASRQSTGRTRQHPPDQACAKELREETGTKQLANAACRDFLSAPSLSRAISTSALLIDAEGRTHGRLSWLRWQQCKTQRPNSQHTHRNCTAQALAAAASLELCRSLAALSPLTRLCVRFPGRRPSQHCSPRCSAPAILPGPDPDGSSLSPDRPRPLAPQ